MGCYLALDQGGHASRALLYSASGATIAQSSVPIATRRTAEGHIEHEPDELMNSLRTAIAEVCRAAPVGTQVATAGLATQRSSMVCWDRQTGAVLSPVISWQDRRNADWLRQFEPQAAEIRERTGLVLTPHYGASKMRWCLDHLPAVQQAAARKTLVMGPLASFITFKLLAERPLVADPANASRTQLWAVDTQDWSPSLLRLFDIDEKVLPAAVTSRYAYGSLSTPLGVVPLTVVTGDQSAVPFAFGALNPARAYVNIGTGAFVQRPVLDQLPSAPRLLISVVWSEAGRVDFLLEGTVNGAGSALEWLAEQEQQPLQTLLNKAERSIREGETPPLFINGVAGIGSPFWNSSLEPVFIGDSMLGSKVVAVLESIAFLLRSNIEEMANATAPLTELLVTGGLSANDYLCRCLGSLCALPILRLDDPEATARGLARLIAAEEAANWPVPAGTRLEFTPNAPLKARYVRWRSALEQHLHTR